MGPRASKRQLPSPPPSRRVLGSATLRPWQRRATRDVGDEVPVRRTFAASSRRFQPDRRGANRRTRGPASPWGRGAWAPLGAAGVLLDRLSARQLLAIATC